MSRGLRNFNPGNIRISKVRYLGEVQPSQDSAFKQFKTMAWGYRAMFVLLHSYSRKGVKTIRTVIMRYAPPVENHTENYINFVATKSSISPDITLDPNNQEMMIPIVSAMSQIENGSPAVASEVVDGWELFRKNRP